MSTSLPSSRVNGPSSGPYLPKMVRHWALKYTVSVRTSTVFGLTKPAGRSSGISSFVCSDTHALILAREPSPSFTSIVSTSAP